MAPGVAPSAVAAQYLGNAARPGNAARHSRIGWKLVEMGAAGVLLLNTCLTVEGSPPAMPIKAGRCLPTLLFAMYPATASPAYSCFGVATRKASALVDASRHLVLTANHPSPLSALRPPAPPLSAVGTFSPSEGWRDRHRGLSEMASPSMTQTYFRGIIRGSPWRGGRVVNGSRL